MEIVNAAEAFILLGPPGSGKSTQAEMCRVKLGIEHIDMGAALRRAAQEPTPFGMKVNEMMNRRQQLVPDEIVRAVLENALRGMPKEQSVMIDGAPRRENQIDEVLFLIERYGKRFRKVIFIELSETDSVERISRRFSCLECGMKLIFGENFFDTKERCPSCGGAVAQRTDDTPEGVSRRWKIFHDDTMPVLRFFEGKGQLSRISGNTSPEKIFHEIERIIIGPSV